MDCTLGWEYKQVMISWFWLWTISHKIAAHHSFLTFSRSSFNEVSGQLSVVEIKKVFTFLSWLNELTNVVYSVDLCDDFRFFDNVYST